MKQTLSKMPDFFQDVFFEVLGVRIAVTNLTLACRKMGGWIDAREKTYVCIAPVSIIMACQDDPHYLDVVNHAGMTTPDGMPLVWIARARGFKQVGRTYGPDLLLAFCEYGLAKGYRHYFYGGTQETNERLIKELKKRFADIRICGHYAPPFRESKVMEHTQVLERINETAPDVLWVGLGSPKQDHWMCQHRTLLTVPVMVGVGAAFDFISGVKPQAPRFLQRCGLEWLFRLFCEPRRLWKRYLIGNTRFVWLLIKERLAVKK